MININLIGENKQIVNGTYSDDYLVKLNEEYPIKNILHSKYDSVLQGDKMTLLSLAQDSPMGDCESESIIHIILGNSAEVGKWIPGQLRPEHYGYTANNYFAALNTIPVDEEECFVDEFMWGLRKSEYHDFVKLVKYEGFVVFIPTEKLIEHCKSNVE
jgi:hypothetical protein